jgi:hypothetical protein
MVWKWRANKGLSYAEDLNNYEDAKQKLIAADKGSCVIRIGRSGRPAGALAAYPRIIAP